MAAAPAYSGPVPRHRGAGAYKAAPAPDYPDWVMEVGVRHWVSNGRMQKDLYDPFNTAQLNSRLTYADMGGMAGEGFARWDHRTGGFVKGYFGVGDLLKGPGK